MRRLLVALVAALLGVLLAACSPASSTPTSSPTPSSLTPTVLPPPSTPTAVPTPGTIGVLLPSVGSTRWVKDGNFVRQQLEAGGYTVQLRFAGDDALVQAQQLDDLVAAGVQAIVVAPVTDTGLTAGLAAAAARGIPVVAYDRLPLQTPDVTYYVTFDNTRTGVLQAESLVAGLTARGTPKPWRIELFAGSAEDNNARLVFDGAMSVLQPLIDDGSLVVGSGQTSFTKAVTPNWSYASAGTRMRKLIRKAAGREQVIDGVLSPSDLLTRAIIDASVASGYGDEPPLPVLTGQDAELANVKLMLAGKQFSTVFKDNRELAKAAAQLVDEAVRGEPVTVNDTTSFDTGALVVPARVVDVVGITAEDAVDVLLAANYYTQDQLGA
ncbi:MAG TPA: sugar ABC transporter substrate-binding protein [Propionicimonas sp.]|nr:sugar ABC transporter substrate-binding protein [Propionicimonas sp.]